MGLSDNRALFLLLTTAVAAACGDTRGSSPSSPNDALDASVDGPDEDGSDSAAAEADGSGAPDGAALCPGSEPDGDGGCLTPSIRRPFFVGASLRSAESETRTDWCGKAGLPDAGPMDARTRVMLARVWLKDALEEHASVAAFARFAMHLLSLGAPPDLVRAAQRASLDEISHAEACFNLSRRYGGKSTGPARLVVVDAMSGGTVGEIVRLAAEEGCVGETLGALLAREQWAVATDAAAKRILRKIAADEARHAELAWRFVAWAIRRFGEDARNGLRAGIDAGIRGTLAADVRVYDGLDHNAFRAHGRLVCQDARGIAVRGIFDVVRPCAERALTHDTGEMMNAAPHLTSS